MLAQLSPGIRRGRNALHPAAAFLALALCAGAADLAAQNVPSAGQRGDLPVRRAAPSVEGRVVNASTGAPLRFATVEIASSRRTAVTDEEGRFRFTRVRPGAQQIRASLIGYDSVTRVIAVADEPVSVELRLPADPVLLEGLTVTSNRFNRRLRAFPSAVRVLEHDVIVASGARNVREFVTGHGGVQTVQCNRGFVRDCILARGGLTAPVVYLDDFLTVGGLDHLEMLSVDEVGRVEVLAQGRQVRVYTTAFLKWAARTRYRPMPLL